MKGLPKAIIKKYGISKKAWAVYRGKKTKRKSNPRPKKARKVKRKVARKKRKRKTRTIPLIPVIAGIGSFWVPRDWNHVSPADGVKRVLEGDMGMAPHVMHDIIATYVGYDPRDGSWGIPMGTVVAAGGIVAHKILTMLGVNRQFANLPSPLNKLRL